MIISLYNSNDEPLTINLDGFVAFELCENSTRDDESWYVTFTFPDCLTLTSCWLRREAASDLYGKIRHELKAGSAFVDLTDICYR